MQWEYKVYNHDTLKGEFIRTFHFDPFAFQAALDAHGREGWELVSIMDINRGNGISGTLVATFKRPIPPPQPMRVTRKADDKDDT